MKLADYAIRDALSRRDWPVAIATLTDHFDIKLPHKYKKSIMSGIGICIVELYFHKWIYSWWEKTGFSCAARQQPEYIAHANIELNIWIT